MDIKKLGNVEQIIEDAKGIEKRLLPFYSLKIGSESISEEYRLSGMVCSGVMDQNRPISLGIRQSKISTPYFRIEDFLGFETGFLELNSSDLGDLPKFSNLNFSNSKTMSFSQERLPGIPIIDEKELNSPYSIIGFVKFN